MSLTLAYAAQALRNAVILIDDVVALAKPALAQFDDIVAMAKPAVGQSSGVVIDDAAVGAGMIGKSTIAQHREYTVWGKIAAGSLINKTILAALFLVLAHVAPVVPEILLGLGGFYLSYEGAHKVWGWLRGGAHEAAPEEDQEGGIGDTLDDWAARGGFFGAVARFLGVDEGERAIVGELLMLDTILATEILLVAMGSVPADSPGELAMVMAVVGFITTIIVYVPILGIMRGDNLAAWLEKSGQGPWPAAGRALRRAIPRALKALGVIGTLAMLEVGGGILMHKIPVALTALAGATVGDAVHAVFAGLESVLHMIPLIGGLLAGMVVGALGGAAVAGGLAFSAKIQGAIRART